MFGILVFAVSGNLLPALLLRIAHDFDVSPELLASVASVQFLGFFLATVMGGILSDYFGKRRIFQVSAICLLTGASLWMGADTVSEAAFCGFLMGMAGGVMESMSSALICDLLPERKTFFLNVSQIAFCVGAAGTPWIIGCLLPRGVSWQIFYGALSVLTLCLFFFYTFSHMPRPSEEDRIHLLALKSLLTRGCFLAPCFVLFCYVLVESCIILYQNLYLQNYLSAPENWAIYSLSFLWLTMTAGRLICAFLPPSLAYEKIIAVLMTLSGLAIFAQSLVHRWEFSMSLFALTGFCFAGTWPLVVAMASSRHPRHSGTVVGLTVAAGSLGVVAAPPFMNAIFALLPDRLAFPASATPLLLALCVLAKRRRNRNA